MIKIVALKTDGNRWRWRIIENGFVIAESRLWFTTMDEALESGQAHAEIIEECTAQNPGGRLRRRPQRTA